MSNWHDAEQHAERAQRFYQAGQWERALEALREALDVRPDEPAWLYGLALTLEALGRYAEAADALQRCLDPSVTDAEVLLRLAHDQARAELWRDCIETLERVSAAHPELAAGYAGRIAAYGALGEHDEAEVMFYLALQADPEHAPAYDAMARSLALRHDDDRAAWCWQEALRLNPDCDGVHRHLALLCVRRGEPFRARRHYQRQLRLTPDATDVLLEFAALLQQMHRHAEAAEQWRRALAVDPTLAVAHLRLGEALLHTGHPAAAHDRLERARQLNPDRPGVHLALAAVAQRRGDEETQRAMLRAELRREGHTPRETLRLAAALIDAGLSGEAVRLLTPLLDGADGRWLGDDAAFAAGLHMRGLARLAVGDTAAGFDDCRRCLAADPDHLGALTLLVRLHLSRGDLDRAAARLGRGLTVAPHDRALRRLRRRLRAQRVRHAVRRWFRLPA